MTSSSDLSEHPAVSRVRAALSAAGSAGEVVVLDEHARTAAAAAEQLGVTTEQIANSLVFAAPGDDGGGDDGDRRAVLVLASGAHRVDTGRVAAALGLSRLERADPDFVRRSTGFAIGGVAPVGHPRPLLTAVDTALSRHDRVWAAAGHPRTVFATDYAELVRLTGGTPVEVAG